MRGRIATCSERLPRCEVAAVSPQSSESALAGRRGCVPRWQKTGGAPSSKPAILRVFYIGTNKALPEGTVDLDLTAPILSPQTLRLQRPTSQPCPVLDSSGSKSAFRAKNWRK